MYKIDCEITGVYPLLQNRMPTPEEMEGLKTTSAAADYSGMMELAKYKLEDDRLCQPSLHVVKSMEEAATDFRIKGKGKKTYKKLIPAVIFIEPDKIPHKIQDYEEDRQWVRIGTSRVLRSRPRLDKWALEFTITNALDQNEFPPDIVKGILEHAGKFKGIGDYRPRYGRFVITSFNVKEEKEQLELAAG